jgi:hypothetical protein
MEHCIDIAHVKSLVDHLQINEVCKEGKVTIVIDGVLLNLVYYYYNNHLELAIMTHAHKSMFNAEGCHIWEHIGFLIDLKFKAQICVVDRMDMNLIPMVTKSQLFQLCDSLCNAFQFRKCKLCTCPKYVHRNIEMSCFNHDLIGLLSGTSYFGSKYGFYGKNEITPIRGISTNDNASALSDILKPIQDLSTYNMCNVVTEFPKCRELLKKSYEFHESCYFDSRLCDRMLETWDKNTEKCKDLLHTCNGFSIGDFLVWCWNHHPQEFDNMIELLFPAPVYRGTLTTSPFFWIGAFDAIWKYCNSKQKLYK